MSLPEVPKHIVDSGVPLILDAFISFKSELTPADVKNFKELQAASNAEEGTDVYEVSRDAGRNDSIRIYERYKNAQALDTHLKASPFLKFISAYGEKVEAMDVKYSTPF